MDLRKFVPPLPPQSHIARAQSWTEMRAIQNPDINLALLQRPPPDCADAINEIQASAFDACQMVFAAGDDPDLIGAELDHILALKSPSAFAFYFDVISLATGFVEATDAPLIGIRLEKFVGEKCPRFHVDQLRYRAVTTFAGATTQWLRNSDVIRSHEKPLRIEVFSLAEIQQFPFGAVGLMKGEGEFNRLKSFVHRSPPGDPRAPRILLRIDALEY